MLVNNFIDYEAGNLSPRDTIKFFATLIQEKLAWSLQGHYGRMATAFIKHGFISSDGEINWELVNSSLPDEERDEVGNE